MRDSELRRPASEVKHQVDQTRAWSGTRSYLDSRWSGCRITQTRIEHALTQACIWNLHASLDARSAFQLKTWPSRWSEVHIRWLVLGDFWTAYRISSKVFGTPRLTGTDLKISWISFEFGLPMIGLAIFWDALSLIMFALWSSWVYCWLLKGSRKDHHKCLRNSV